MNENKGLLEVGDRCEIPLDAYDTEIGIVVEISMGDAVTDNKVTVELDDGARFSGSEWQAEYIGPE